MYKFRKAISAGLTATMLASLFTVIAASSVLAATTVTSAGSVPRGGTSTGTVTITLTENSAACLDEIADTSSTIVIDDADGGDVTWSGTIAVSAPGSLGATATRSGDTVTVETTGASDAVTEQIIITGLTITAASTATPGAIVAALVDGSGGCWTATTRTATGTISVGIAAGSTNVIINNTNSCDFVLSAGAPGPLSFATLPETVEITAVAAGPGVDQQTLGIDATSNNHQLGETVTQADVPVSGTCPATLGSPGTVVDALEQTATSVQIFPGENNQAAGDTTVSEVNAGFLAAGTVITFTLDPAGVLFSGGSSSPLVTVAGAGFALTSGTCAVSVDRRSCTVTVDTASAAPASITLENPLVDVAASVPSGTLVKAVVTTSPTKLVNVTSNTIAIVSRIIVGIAATPTIYIGENDQQTGQLTLTETGAGFFTAGPGPTNNFAICLQSGESFIRAPWAVVTTGDLKLFSGVVAATQSKGTLYNSNTCARWSVFSASTAASTIEIRGTDSADVVLASGSLNGPRVNVPPGLTPGPLLADVLIGSLAEVTAETGLTVRVSNAVRAFRSGVNVVAVSQPVIGQGTTGMAGNITISETLAGQLKSGQDICLEVLPRTSTGVIQARQDTFFATANTNQLPTATTNASGLLVTRSFVDNNTACFEVQQQAVGTLGVLTISNINLTTLADAPFGSILIEVSGDDGTGNATPFEAVVSNARIGNPIAGTAATRLGVTQVGAFTTSTKVQRTGRYVTYRFDFGVGAAGQAVRIYGATKTGNDWSAFTVVTTRLANASGVVYYHIRHNSATWRSYRGNWAGGGSWTPARQARWIP